jgi:SAM-dependent methyltransferase
MNPDEYYALYKVEKEHWFYSGKRLIVREWLRRLGFLTHRHTLLDVGAGTGLFAEEMSQHLSVIALDPDANALGLLKQRREIITSAGSAETLPLADNSVHILTALDVVEHLDDDKAALREFTRVVRPGGLVIITVPAFMSLWSEWDDALHHRRRYTFAQLTCAWQGLNLQVVHSSYINTLAFFPIYLYRQWRNLLPAQKKTARAEDWVPRDPLNSLLRQMFVQPALWSLRLPVGVSVFAILRKM